MVLRVKKKGIFSLRSWNFHRTRDFLTWLLDAFHFNRWFYFHSGLFPEKKVISWRAWRCSHHRAQSQISLFHFATLSLSPRLYSAQVFILFSSSKNINSVFSFHALKRTNRKKKTPLINFIFISLTENSTTGEGVVENKTHLRRDFQMMQRKCLA